MTITPNKWELDVQGYLNTCNITSATPRKQIRDFSAGVNDLGLWNSMVCWPLRSSQNYGSGTTAFSLGGLGTYNGTLVDGPSWSDNGLIANGSGYVTTGITNMFFAGGATPWQLLVCYSSPALVGGGTLISRASATLADRVFQIYGSSTFSAVVRGTDTGTAIAMRGQGKKFVSLSYDGSACSIDNTAVTIGAATDDGHPLQFLSRTSGANVYAADSELVGVIGIHGASSSATALSSLFKTTLGQGLTIA